MSQNTTLPDQTKAAFKMIFAQIENASFGTVQRKAYKKESRNIDAALEMTSLSIRALAQEKLLLLAWLAVGLWVIVGVLRTYLATASSPLSLFTSLSVDFIAIFVLVPNALCGYKHLSTVKAKWLGTGSGSYLGGSTINLFITTKAGAQSLEGYNFSYARKDVSVSASTINAVRGVTSDEVATPYIILSLKDGKPYHLLNVSTGVSKTWTNGIEELETNSEKIAGDFLKRLQALSTLDAIKSIKVGSAAGSSNSSAGAAPAAADKAAEKESSREEDKYTTEFIVKKADAVADTGKSWDSLILNAGFKEELQSVVQQLKNAKKLREKGFTPPTSMLLYGPPGTGKTEVARTISSAGGINFIAVSTSDINGMFKGQSTQNVKRLFKLARKNSPCVIFMDELEVITPRRDGQNVDASLKETVAEMLVEMDGCGKGSGEVFVIAASNFPEHIDPAIMSRFMVKKEVALPDLAARRKMLDVFLAGKPIDSSVRDSLSEMAKSTEGLSGRAIKGVVEVASQRAVGRALRLGDIDNISLMAEDFAS